MAQKVKCLTCANEFYPKTSKHKYCCRKCADRNRHGYKILRVQRGIYSDDEVFKRINAKYSHIEYAGDYVSHNGGTLLVRCKDCGNIWKVSNEILKPSKKAQCICQNCNSVLKNKRKADATQRRKEKSEHEKNKRQLAALQKNVSTQVMTVCECCGSLFVKNENTRKKYCSSRCLQRANDVKKRHIRRMRKKSQLIDNDISLEKLYERDKGICYICGCKCDWNDYNIKDGAFIVKETYPTQDHVIPLSKNGMHSWDNLKLACFRCNTLKGGKIEDAI